MTSSSVAFAKPRGFLEGDRFRPKATRCLRPLLSGPEKKTRSARSGIAAACGLATASVDQPPPKRAFATFDRSGCQRAATPNRGGTADGGNCLNANGGKWPRRDRARFILGLRGDLYSPYFWTPGFHDADTEGPVRPTAATKHSTGGRGERRVCMGVGSAVFSASSAFSCSKLWVSCANLNR